MRRELWWQTNCRGRDQREVMKTSNNRHSLTAKLITPIASKTFGSMTENIPSVGPLRLSSTKGPLRVTDATITNIEMRAIWVKAGSVHQLIQARRLPVHESSRSEQSTRIR